MKLFLKSDLPRQIQHIKHGGISIRRRFIVYIISAIVLVLSLILLFSIPPSPFLSSEKTEIPKANLP